MISAFDARTPASSPPSPPARVGLLLAILGALTAIGPLSIDMYVPGFPAMGTSLGTTSTAIQLTMTTFLIGLVIGQVVIGALSDGIGRRKLLVFGTLGFFLFSALCAIAPSVGVLIVARFFQGVTGATGMVLARAVIMDRFTGAAVPRYFAVLSQVTGIAPVLAPVLGGAVLAVSTWRAIFVVLAVVGVILFVAVLTCVPESLPPDRRSAGGLAAAFRSMGSLLSHRTYMGYVLLLAFTGAAMFAYVGASSFIFENLHHVTSTTYSLIFASNAVGMLIAGSVFGWLSRTVRMNWLLLGGIGCAVLGAAAQVVVLGVVGESLAGTWICLFVTMTGIGLIIPASLSLGQSIGHNAPGAASALLGGLQFLFGALTAPVLGLFGESSSAPMSIIMLVTLAIGAVLLCVLSRPWRGYGELS